MSGTWVEVPVAGGAMAAYRVGSGPGVVMLQEIFGVNAAMRDKAARIAAHGYCVLVPDLFWRLQRRVELDYAGEDRAKAFDFFGRFDAKAGVDDIAAAARWLEKEAAEVAVIGFCLGGKLAVAATAAYPFKAVASLYGVRLEQDVDRLRAIAAPLQIHVGDRDTHVPREAIEKIQEAVQGRDNARVFIYPGAQHGFFNPRRADVFSPEAARQAEERVAQMFALSLRR